MNTIGNSKIHEIISVVHIKDFLLEIKFDDGITKIIDVKPFIGGGISEELKNPAFFNKVYVDNGALTWPNGYDFCPVFLRNEL